jgi:site-specific recombinase
MDHASVKVVHQVVKMQQAVVPIALLDIFQRLLQRQNARHVQKDMHKKSQAQHTVYHVPQENINIWKEKKHV